MIDWEDMVKEYKKQYDDEDGIHEFIDSLLPVHYGDIYFPAVFNVADLSISIGAVLIIIYYISNKTNEVD